MRRFIAYLDPLLLGMILGMTFVAILDSCPSRWQEKVCTTGITIGDNVSRAFKQQEVRSLSAR